MDPIQLVLGTRTGHRTDPARYDQCKWNLIHPIFPPNADYETTVSVSYVSMPGDRDRLNAGRGTVDLYFVNNASGEWQLFPDPINIPAGSYTTGALVNVLNKSTWLTDTYKHIFKLDRDYGRYRLYATDPVYENTIRVANRSDLGFESLADAMGYTGNEFWGVLGYADRPPDLQGSRTMTIRSNLGSNHMDPMTLSHRSHILAVIPADTGDINRPNVWENKYYTTQRVTGAVVDTI